MTFQEELVALVRQNDRYEPLLELYDMVGEKRFQKVLYAFAGQTLRFPAVNKVQLLMAKTLRLIKPLDDNF